MDTLARQGSPFAARVPEMTARETELETALFKARLEDRAQELDTLAWLIGSYTGLAVNAPKKYPRRPRAQATRKRKPMTDDEMKAVMLGIAERANNAAEME